MNKVLIVDDSATTRTLLARVLRQGCRGPETVLEAANGIEGLERLDSDPDVGLILSDVDMPGMDGLAFVRALRSRHPREALPVVLITAEGCEEGRRSALECGANGTVARPFTPDSIRAEVDRVLS